MAQTILIIEDDDFFLDMLTKKFSSEGFSVVQAIDAEQGLNKLKDQKPDIILSDLVLPSMDGFELLAKVKENPETKNIPFIFLSSISKDDEVGKAKTLGAVDFLVKSDLHLDQIVAKVKEHLK